MGLMMRTLCICLMLSASPALAIVGGQPPAEDDRRIDAVGAWSRASWLGLGNNPVHEHNWFGGATLIRANLVVTAKHIAEGDDAPSGTYAVRFRRRIDGGLGSREQGAFSYHHALVDRIVHGPGDLALAYLVEPVTHITPLPVMQMGFLGLEGAPYISAGWGQEGPGQAEGPRNQLLVCAQNSLTRINLNQLSYPGFGTRPEPACKVNRWDSGGAVLVEDQGRLWLLASHHTYTSAPTLWRWLDEAQPQMLHSPFTQPDLAVEQTVVTGTLDIQRGETVDLEVRISNPGPRRVTAEQGDLVVEVHAPGLRGDEATELLRQTLPRYWQSRQRRVEPLQAALPESLPVGLYRLNSALSGMGASDLTRNNRVSLDGVVSVRSRANPYRRLGVGGVFRTLEDGSLNLVNIIYVERSHGRHALWAFGSTTPAGESFTVVKYDNPTGVIDVDTPWGTITLTMDQEEPLGVPEGFGGAFNQLDAGMYSPFAGVYEGRGPQSEQVALTLLPGGQVVGALTSEDLTNAINVRFEDLAYRAEAAQNQTAFRALELSWDETRDESVLVMVDDQGQRFKLEREELAVDLYDECRNRLQCHAFAGDRSTQCYQAAEETFGVCVAFACADDESRCGDHGRCLIEPDLCAPTCAEDTECPTSMTCTHEGVCIDCAVYPSLCVVPDGGPAPDAGVDASSPDASMSDAGLTDAGTSEADAGPMIDAGSVEPAPSQGCSCADTTTNALWWLVPVVVIARRRHRRAARA